VRLGRACALALATSALLPATAAAHALIGNQDPNRPLPSYPWLGFLHMVGGWDHLLFIAGVVLVAGALRPAAKLISLFVAGHSLTLLVATLAGWKLDATVVDVVITLSLVIVGIYGLRFGRPQGLRFLGAVVFLFGLVHGLGLSTRLQALGLPDGGLVARVVLFNVGVELGQLTALAIIVGVGAFIADRLRLEWRHAQTAFGALAAFGLTAATVISFPRETTQGQETAVAERTARACTQKDARQPYSAAGEHPAKYYYGPREDPPVEDLRHVIGDGLIIIRYRPGLRRAEHRRLKAFIAAQKPPYVIAAPDARQATAVKAIVAARTLECKKLLVSELQTFRDDWIAEVQSGRAG